MRSNAVPAVTTMLQEMDQSEFGQFVAALWDQQGWETQVKTDDGRTFVAVQRPETGDEGLLWAIPASAGEVGGKQVQQFVKLCREYGVDEAAIVSAGSASDHAEKAAQGTQIKLLDGEGVMTFLERRDMTDLLERHAGGATGGGSDGGSPVDRVRAIAETAVGRVSGLAGGVDSRGLALAVVVAVAIVAAGVLGVPSIPFIGGGGDDITAESVSPEGANASLYVAWNAATTDTIDPNESDELAYRAPEGTRFVVVRMSVNNTGETQTPLRQAAFRFRANGTTYDNQTLADHDGFVDLPMGPTSNRVVWTVFVVPEGVSGGTLVYDQNATDATVAVEFERDTAISTNVTAR
ncbi:restriction endonuclease [Halorussus marinus]|uniref:restriction endonuclease n=1 Tax=Halorussus marinus TaxID=2505976 RepID=UPI0010931DD2|nr:restriction endonuclease [Halorussus marinus]